jgi:hypothetical protein
MRPDQFSPGLKFSTKALGLTIPLPLGRADEVIE